jgi:hypothetical protein
MTGKVADLLVSDVHITANKNTVPFDPPVPFRDEWTCVWAPLLAPPAALMKRPSVRWRM